MDPLRPSLLESNPSSIQPNQLAQNIFCGETSPANGTDVAAVLTVLSAMFPHEDLLVRAIWRGLPGVRIFPAARLVYPILRNFFWKSPAFIPVPSSLIVNDPL
jgi:hypothetical protein